MTGQFCLVCVWSFGGSRFCYYTRIHSGPVDSAWGFSSLVDWHAVLIAFALLLTVDWLAMFGRSIEGGLVRSICSME